MGRRIVIGLWLGALVLGVFALTALATPLPSGRTALATTLYDCHGKVVTTLYAENRQPVTLDEIPVFLQHAVVAVEDDNFYSHGGISLRGIVRAIWRDLTQGRREGASTITQQLARTVYLDTRRTVWRKLAEIFYAFKMELHMSKDEILTGYLNQIYFGQGAYGIKTASEAYFDRELDELNQAEQAFLAGVLRSPENYSPWKNLEAAQGRSQVVLERMKACGYLSDEETGVIAGLPLRFKKPGEKGLTAPYFASYVRQFLADLLPEGTAGVYRAGLTVETTLDLDWQQAAEAAMARLEKAGAEGPQGCLVAIDPATGAIRAMVGGRDYTESQFNRVTQSKRQPGSAFKPIVYAEALEQGYTLATMRDCASRTFEYGTESYTPANSSGPKEGVLSLRDALAVSSNVVAVELGSELGPESVASFAKKLGIESPIGPYLSLPLGTSELTPLELASAYAVFANGGLRVEPYAVSLVRSADGRVIYRDHPFSQRVVKTSTAFLIAQALTDVFGPQGTASGLSPGRPAAGKTGTSDGNRDAWFAGFTPDLVSVVHAGYDQGNRPLPGSGGSLAAPIWSDFVRRALSGSPAKSFVKPDDVCSLVICPESGQLAGPGCPSPRSEYFALGTEPTTICRQHRMVRVVVCAHSHLLPGSNCHDLEIVEFKPGEEPAEICDQCRGGLLDWLDDLLNRGESAPSRPPGEEEPPAGTRTFRDLLRNILQ